MTSIEDLLLSSKETTFQYDKDLLTLPVPDLSDTLKKYLESVRPLATDEEYKQTEFLVNQFATGEGKLLQEKLQEKASKERNWLDKWWEDVAYLEVRLQSPLMNMAGPGPYSEDVWPPKMGTQIPHAALSIYYTLKFWEFIRKEQYRPMKDGKGRPLCMYQFKRIFNTCSVPGVFRDKLVHYFKVEREGDCPSHIIVISKGHLFLLDCCDGFGKLLSPPELQSQLQKIKDRSLKLGPAQGVTYLTAEERTKWAQLRNQLIALNPKNYETIQKIQSSVVNVWLEDGVAGDVSNLAHKSLLGSGENRWLDKALSSGFYEDGQVVSNADHTPAEGMMMVYITSYIHTKLIENKGQWQGSTTVRDLPEPELLQFVLNDDLEHAIEVAKKNYAVIQDCAEVEIRIFNKYGKAYCKQLRVHPDAYCQLAMQLAFYRTYRRMGPTYETAPIKQFYHGRTETMRSCTNEAKAWCEAMMDPAVGVSERYKLFMTAVKKHNKDFADACEFKACDRHLLGLYLMSKESGMNVPMLFQDPSFYKTGGGGNYLLSTSCIGYSSVLGAVLPMCKHGIGTFYRINDNRLSFYITTWKEDETTCSRGFADAICASLDDMKSLLDQAHPVNPAKL